MAESSHTKTYSLRKFRTLTYWAMVIGLSIIIFGNFIYIANYKIFKMGQIVPSMVYGTGNKPFVYRALLPITVRLLMPIVPESMVDLAMTWPPINFAVSTFDPNYTKESFITMVLMYLSLIAFIFSFRFLMKVTKFSEWAIGWLTVLCLIFLPAFSLWGRFYDFTSLFLFTLALALMVEKRWPTYFVAFTLSCINKETTILLPIIFAVYYRHRLPRPLLLKLFGGQVAIFLVIKIALTIIFSGNEGTMVEWHLTKYLAAIQNHPQSFILGPLWLIIFLGYRWYSKPEILRVAIMVCLPLLIELSIFLGYPFELRACLEIYPIGLLLIAGGLIKPKYLYIKDKYA